MTPNRQLISAAAAIGLIACTIAAAVFLATHRPSDGVRVRVPTASLERESYRYVPDMYEGKHKADLLLVRGADGRLTAWYVPVRDGSRRLPDPTWWTPGLRCDELRPDFRSAEVACHDADLPEWARSRFRWTLQGKSLTGAVDLLPVKGTEESGHFLVYESMPA